MARGDPRHRTSPHGLRDCRRGGGDGGACARVAGGSEVGLPGRASGGGTAASLLSGGAFEEVGVPIRVERLCSPGVLAE